jgi:hypothetical protein
LVSGWKTGMERSFYASHIFKDEGAVSGNKILLLFFILLPFCGNAQSHLDKLISITMNNQPVSEVLSSISKQGGFYFSYDSRLIRADSIVSLNRIRQPVRQILMILFPGRFTYRESGNYIIIQNPSDNLSAFTISGRVTDALSGEKIEDASIYEPNQLISVFSDEEGYFHLTLKNKQKPVFIHISKISYLDTVISLSAGWDQDLPVAIHSSPYELNPVNVSNKVEKTWVARLFLSSGQMVQSLNLSKFFANKPYQFSLTPGLGTHGQMSAQVINKFSLNIIGGYTAGVNGVEIGGVFNIVKQDVKKWQVAGMFNVVGGKLNGVQVGGIQNTVLDSVQGIQVAGLMNRNKSSLSGFQVGGLYNRTEKEMKGVQLAGLVNSAGYQSKSFQLAGLMNFTKGGTRGVQVSALLNYTKSLSGVQFGIVNINMQDSSEAYSFGLINITRSYHVLSLFTDELGGLDLEFKSGSRKLFSILHAGFNPGNNHKQISLGFGLGSEIRLSRKFLVSPELSRQWLYTGTWEDLNEMFKFKLNLGYRISSRVSVFAGPSFTIYNNHQESAIPGYQFPVPKADYILYKINTDLNGWIGWSFGINLF